MTATKKVFIMVSRGVEASSILLEILAVGQQEGRTFELFLFISFCFACPHLNQRNPTHEPEKGTFGRRSAKSRPCTLPGGGESRVGGPQENLQYLRPRRNFFVGLLVSLLKLGRVT
jgi:hypothetical protein